MNTRKITITAVLFALLLGSVVASPAAAQTDDYDNCDRGGVLDPATWDERIISGVDWYVETTSLGEVQVQECWDVTSEQVEDDNSTYQDGISMEESTSQTLTELNNNLIGIQDIARTEAVIAYAEYLANHNNTTANETEAVNAAHNAARNYISKTERNTVALWNYQVIELRTMRAELANSHGIDPNNTSAHDPVLTGVGRYYNNDTYFNILHSGNGAENSVVFNTVPGESAPYEEVNYSLVNGSNVSVEVLGISTDAPSGNGLVWPSATGSTEYEDGVIVHIDGQEPLNGLATNLEGNITYGVAVAEPNGTEVNQVIYSYKYRQLLDGIESKEDNVLTSLGNESQGYLHDVYSLYQAGEINATDLLTYAEYSRMNLDEEDVGSRIWYRYHLGRLGYQASANASFDITVHNGSSIGGETLNESKTVSGDLYSRAEPEGGDWVSGQTYHTDNFSSPVILVRTVQEEVMEDGEITVQTYQDDSIINGSFTIDEITNTDTGETVESANTTSHVPNTSNASAFEAEMQEYIEWFNDRKDELAASGGGGSGSCTSISILGLCTGIKSIYISAGAVILFALVAIRIGGGIDNIIPDKGKNKKK